MPIYLNGQKYIGGYMNGHRVNGYINGQRMFNYIASLHFILNNNDGTKLQEQTINVPSGKSYNFNDLQNYGLNSAFSQALNNPTINVENSNTLNYNVGLDYSNPMTWNGKLYAANPNQAHCRVFYQDDDSFFGDGWELTYYTAPFNSCVQNIANGNDRPNDGMFDVVNIDKFYIDKSGIYWLHGDIPNTYIYPNGEKNNVWVKDMSNAWVDTLTPLNDPARNDPIHSYDFG